MKQDIENLLKIPPSVLLIYEIQTTPILGWVSWGWMQNICAKYMAWKVNRKRRLLKKALDTINMIENNTLKGTGEER